MVLIQESILAENLSVPSSSGDVQLRIELVTVLPFYPLPDQCVDRLAVPAKHRVYRHRTALAAASSEALPLSDLGAQELPPAGHEERDY